MPSHATRTPPRNSALRRFTSRRAIPAALAQAHTTSASTARKRREHTGETVQPRAKLWHIALGMIALLCSGIDLG
jgi:hypothetical protein